MDKIKCYLPFEVDFIQNDLHSELIERYGAHGLGIYFMVLMELRNHEGYRCGLSTIKDTARRCMADPEMLESVLCDFQLFEFQECGDRVMISSVYIGRVMQPFEEKIRDFSSTVNKNTVTVERPVHGMSTVTHREIINKIEIKIKTKTTTSTTNKEAAAAANVDAAVAAVKVNTKTGTPQPGKLRAEHPGKTTVDERCVKALAHFMRQTTPIGKRIATLSRQHDMQPEKRSPHRLETGNLVTGERGYFGNIIPEEAAPRPPTMRCGQPGLGKGGRGEMEYGCASAQMLPSFGANATFIRRK